MIARGAARKARGINRTEAEYRDMLAVRKIAGEVLWFKYEAVTLRLADDTRYTPDFAVMLANGELEMHEVKGFMRDDAAVKLKVAAESFPFRFVLARKIAGAWVRSEV